MKAPWREQIGAGPTCVCTVNSIRVDPVTELPIVNDDGRAVTLFARAVLGPHLLASLLI